MGTVAPVVKKLSAELCAFALGLPGAHLFALCVFGCNGLRTPLGEGAARDAHPSPHSASSAPSSSHSAVTSSSPPGASASEAGAVPLCAKPCLSAGLCTTDAGTCRATSNDDCLHSELCWTEGLCTLHDGACVWGGGDCRSARGSHERNPCREEARCTARDYVCSRLSSADCALSDACEYDGRCTFEAGACVLASDADCRKACAVHGRCKRTHETLDSNQEPGPHCVAASAKQCRASEDCRVNGLCELAPSGAHCVAGTDSDCARAGVCSALGLCASGFAFGWPDARCTGKDEASCAKSQGCAARGDCHLVTSPPPFMMPGCGPTSDADCLKAEACRLEGFCHFDAERMTCAVTGDADCAQADACKRESRCHFDAASTGAKPCALLYFQF